MAIQPKNEYGAQTTAPGATYPYGRARNDTDVSAHDGTPLEEKWVNDVFGFEQALLVEAEITPSGNPDTAIASQYLDALKVVAQASAHDALDTSVSALQDSIVYALGQLTARLPTSLTVTTPLIMTHNYNDRFAYYVFDAPACSTVLRQESVAGGGKIVCPVPLPFPGMKIVENGVRVYLIGASGHSALPAQKPVAGLSVHALSGTATFLGSANDLSASVEEYEELHYINPSTSEQTLTMSDQYHVELTGEADTNALVGLQIRAIRVQLSPA
jgi:hypothetical protein